MKAELEVVQPPSLLLPPPVHLGLNAQPFLSARHFYSFFVPHCIPGSWECQAGVHSGKEFSSFDLALDFDVALCLQQRIQEQETMGLVDEEELTTPLDTLDTLPNPPSRASMSTTTSSPSPSTPSALASPLASLSASERNKAKSRARRDKKRDAARAASDNPVLKTVNQKRIDNAKKSAMEIDIDATDIPHSKPAWVGNRSAGEQEFEFTEPQQPHDLQTGLGNVS
ncbi:hypothetical protein C8R43DRAFT_1137041 [Mycena crocata]|nr:hypothetical protein C8R43DRAFT_1137041 [Mycena crocata]